MKTVGSHAPKRQTGYNLLMPTILIVGLRFTWWILIGQLSQIPFSHWSILLLSPKYNAWTTKYGCALSFALLSLGSQAISMIDNGDYGIQTRNRLFDPTNELDDIWSAAHSYNFIIRVK